MPHFYNYSATKEFGKVTVTPNNILRRFVKFGAYSPLPYVTMSKISFTLKVERLPQRDESNRTNRNVYIKLGDGSYRTLITLSDNKTDITGTAEYTGDTKFFIAPASYWDKSGEKFIDKEGLLRDQ